MKKGLFIAVLGVLFTGILFNMPLSAGTPSQDLQSGIQKKNSEKVKKAVQELVAQNDAKSCSTLLEALNPVPEIGIYWIIVDGLSRFADNDAIAKLTAFILSNKDKNVGRDLLGTMTNNRSPGILSLLKDVLEKGPPDMKMTCLEQLGAIKSKESIETLINFLRPLDKEKDRELIKETIGILKRLSGVDKGTYVDAWILWWNENRNKDINEIIKAKTTGGGTGTVADYRDMKGVEDLPKDKVLVVRNDFCDKHFQGDRNYDKIQDILEKMGVPHTVIGKSDIESEKFDWKNTWALIINCNMYKEVCCGKECGGNGQKAGERTQGCIKTGVAGYDHMTHGTKFSDKAIANIKKFVETGGYLFTEDMNIEEVIERAFKGIITHTKYLPEKVVQIVPAPGATLHPYLKYVFEAPPGDAPGTPEPDGKSGGTTKAVKPGEFRIDSEWKIDNDSPDLKVLKKDTVTVLIMSPKLVNTKSKDEGAVAVTWGVAGETFVTTGSDKSSYVSGGRVLHVMSHFGKQKSKVDEFALQNLLLNFLIELNQRRPRGKK